MEISVFGAKENNLKNIDVKMPLGKIIGITGVSGSGKSTLAKDVLARFGYKNYVLTLPNSSKSFISDDDLIDVDAIENLPTTLLIDVINSINNPRSTLATVTGIHNQLRKIFADFGEVYCTECGEIIDNNIFNVLNSIDYLLLIELKIDSKFEKRVSRLKEISKIYKIVYFDANDNVTTKKKLQKYCYIYLNNDGNIKKLSEKINKQLGVSLKIQIDDNQTTIDITTQIICKKCKHTFRKKTMKLLSFNIDGVDGGGACCNCNGLGKNTFIDLEKLVEDKDKPMILGGIKFIGKKGLQYTSITEKFLEAVCKKYEFSLEMSYDELTDIQKNILLYGNDEVIKFTDRQGANNGKKEEVFRGIVFYLEESFKKGKGKKSLMPYFNISICSECEGTRIDKELKNIKVLDYSIHDFLKMTVSELKLKVENLIPCAKNQVLRKYLLDLKLRLEVFEKVGCGYLTLNRDSITLSGGELQRLRLCSFIGSKINEMCIILDEPTTGLHFQDIQYIIDIIYELKRNGNTVVIVEHNKQLLNICDHIVDLGLYGGKNGGELLFSDSFHNINKYSTPTTLFLQGDACTEKEDKLDDISEKQMIYLENISVNNIHNETVKFPLNSFTSICGVSGSGKSSFTNMALIPKIQKNPKLFGVSGIENLGQKNSVKSIASNVGSLLGINDKIANLFSNIDSKFKASCFMINSKIGKCRNCDGKGIISDSVNSKGEICPDCEGKIFDEEVLGVQYKYLNIFEILNMPIQELAELMIDEKNIVSVLDNCVKIGIGYLSLARTSKTLSKGEIQRIKLVATLTSSKNNYIYVLDEPTRGLHHSDISKLYQFIIRVVNAGNTVLAIEHNLDFIKKSDYIIEFGPKSGKAGGKVVFNGIFSSLIDYDTPTSKAFKSKVETYKQVEIIKNKKIHWQIDGMNVVIEKNNINFVDVDEENLGILFNYANNEYLRVLSPATNFISSSFEVDKNIQVLNSPIIRKIDPQKRMFSKKSRIVDALNISNEIATIFVSSTGMNDNMSKQVFDINSKIGKCKVCKGDGQIETVDLSLLMENGIISKETEALLKKRSNYTLAKKYLKKLYKVDICKNYFDMSIEEKQIFVYGDCSKVFYDKGKEYYWEGLNKIIIKQIGYYVPEVKRDEIKNSKKVRSCDICNGSLIAPKYRGICVNGISYSQFLDCNICEIANIISKNDKLKNEIYVKKLVEISNIFSKFDLYNLKLNTLIDELSVFERAILQYISYKVNNLYNSIIIFNGLNWIEKEGIKNVLVNDLEDIIETNTVIINKSTNN